MNYILALDQGTTSCRAIVFDHDGHIASVAQREFTQFYPRPGWVEHDAAEIWRVQRAVMEEAAGVVGAQAIAAIGITNQRETVVVWDRETGTPLAPAIVWQDRRTAERCGRLKADGVEPMVQEKTGLRLDPYFSATKLTWLFENVSGLREKAEAGRALFGTIDTWLLWNLTDGRVHATDVSNASRTLLFNLHALDWDDDLLALFDVPRACLPEVRASSEVYGEAKLLGRRVPVSGMAGDQQAALFGQTCFAPGMAKNTYGTGCFLLLNTGDVPVTPAHGLLSTLAWRVNDKTTYALEGSVFVAGAAVQWLRDGLGIIADARETETLARSVPDAGGVVFVPAFAGLGTPHWNPHARGMITGLTRGTTRAHLVRAALEAIAFQSSDVLDAMNQTSGVDIADLRVDGGAATNDFLLQFQADLLNVPVTRPVVGETTALGAAFLAGLAVGFWKDGAELAGLWAADRTFQPSLPETERAALYAGWQRAVGYQAGSGLPNPPRD